MTMPEGAIGIEEFKQLVERAKAEGPIKIYIVVQSCLSGNSLGERYINIYSNLYKNAMYYSDKKDKDCSCTRYQHDNEFYLFENYWHAYAYLNKLKWKDKT